MRREKTKPINLLPFAIVLILVGCKTTSNVSDVGYSDVEIASIVKQAEEMDGLINVSAREYYEVYMSLGQAYMQTGQYASALDAIKKGLRLNARDYEYQLLAARAEFEIEDYTSAYCRLNRILHNSDSERIRNQARKLSRTIEKLKIVTEQPAIREMRHKYVYLLAVDPVDELYLLALKNRTKSEFGISVRLVESEMEPVKTDLRDRHDEYYLRIREWFIDENGLEQHQEVMDYLKDRTATTDEKTLNREFAYYLFLQTEDGQETWDATMSEIQDQYNGDVLLNQIREEYDTLIDEENCLGLLAITAHDIYARNYNFLFGWNSSDVALMSYNRFVSDDVPLSTKIKRTIMQGFSSVGFLVGIPRCTVDTCARAYPHSLREHDQKEDVLCNECMTNLAKAYEGM